MLKEAADQGHMNAQAHCGTLYRFGWGVARDDRLGLVYYEKAAQQGDATCQANAGVCYSDGLGCEQSNERAAEWFEISFIRTQAGMVTSAGWLTQP